MKSFHENFFWGLYLFHFCTFLPFFRCCFFQVVPILLCYNSFQDAFELLTSMHISVFLLQKFQSIQRWKQGVYMEENAQTTVKLFFSFFSCTSCYFLSLTKWRSVAKLTPTNCAYHCQRTVYSSFFVFQKKVEKLSLTRYTGIVNYCLILNRIYFQLVHIGFVGPRFISLH